jgi:glycosyltransferase involved in cell wall biosynthesis
MKATVQASLNEDDKEIVRNPVALFLPDLCLGGAERVMVHLANALAARRRLVDMVLVEAKGEFLAELDPAVRVVDLKTARVLRAIPRLAAYFRRVRPAVAISALDHANFGAAVAKWLSRSGIPIIAAIHSTRSVKAAQAKGIWGAVLRRCITLCYRRAAAIVCVSGGVADDLAEMTGARRDLMQIIYNPIIDERLFALAREPLDHAWYAPGAPPVVLTVGRLAAVKDYQGLIRAFAVASRKNDLRLLILGEGPERSKLENLVADLGLRDRVALPGFCSNPYAYMARAALFVVSSVSEALPTALIEAMAVGTPVVATDCKCGPREILQNGRFGRLVPVQDVPALAAAISAALLDPRREIPQEALLPYTMDFAVDRYCRLIEGITRE